MNDSDQNAATSPKLDLKTKLAFGAGDLGPAITANISIFYLLVFLISVAGIRADLAGSVLLIGKIWDAVNDPLMGSLTDKTKSRRWGRRLPWMLYGAIPFGIFFFLQWIVPQFSGDRSTNISALFWYYVVIGLISQVFYTVVNLPYTAMTPELTQDYDERTNLNSFRFAFSIGGSLLSLIMVQIVFWLVSGDKEQYTEQQFIIIAAICAVISIVSLYWCVFGVRDRILAFEAKRTQLAEPPALPFVEQLKIAFSNRPFLFVIGIYLFSWLALQLTASIMPFFIMYCLHLGKLDVNTVLMVVQFTALIMLFFWSNLSEKIGKKQVYFLGMILWIIAATGLFFLQPGQLVLMYIMAVMAGAGVSTAYLIPWSMMPDVIELDELHTGQRREGIFYSFMVFLQKCGLGLALFLVGNALKSAGFQEAVAGQSTLPIQPESALTAIRFAVGVLPTVCLIFGLILTYFYPITREMHAEILLKLKARQEEQGK